MLPNILRHLNYECVPTHSSNPNRSTTQIVQQSCTNLLHSSALIPLNMKKFQLNSYDHKVVGETINYQTS
jgi:hypothetical protein